MSNAFERWFANKTGQEPAAPETPQDRFDRLVTLGDPDMTQELQMLKSIKDNVEAGNAVRGDQGDVVKADLLLHNLNARLQKVGERPFKSLEELP